jgi:hypothetical protein
LEGHEVLIDLPDNKVFQIDMPILRQAGGGLSPWDRRAGLDQEGVALLQRRLRRIRVVVADAELRDLAVARERELLAVALDAR